MSYSILVLVNGDRGTNPYVAGPSNVFSFNCEPIPTTMGGKSWLIFYSQEWPQQF